MILHISFCAALHPIVQEIFPRFLVHIHVMVTSLRLSQQLHLIQLTAKLHILLSSVKGI